MNAQPGEAMTVMNRRNAYDRDLRDVRGQLRARRALEIAAAGGHNLLMIGPPGCGKTMLALRLPGILPAREGDSPRPLRAPHHTASAVAMLGRGGETPRPGEVSMADGGVLFLDQVAEFHPGVLEALREPLEYGRVTLADASGKTKLPARFQLVAATGPCPCGECSPEEATRRCTAEFVKRYRRRVGRTIGAHLHVVVEMRREGEDRDAVEGEDSACVRARVARAREAQKARWGVLNRHVAVETLREDAMLAENAEWALERARKQGRQSERTAETVLRVARTIADLEGDRQIAAPHALEALSYRPRDEGASWIEGG